MSFTINDLAERERRRWMRENAHIYVRHDAHRFVRPDAHRFLGPDAPGWKHPDHKLRNPHFRYRDGQTEETRAAPAIPERRALESGEPAIAEAKPSLGELLKLKSDLATLRVQLAVIKHEIATRKARGLPPLTEADEGWQIILRGLARFQDACRKAGLQNVDGKAGFNPAQPRVPAGNPDGGQWTSDGSAGGEAGAGMGTGSGSDTSGGITDPRILSDATPDNDWIPGAQFAQAEIEDQIILAAGRGGIAKQFLKLSVREFVSRFCKASINRELPSQFEDVTIADVLEIAKGGDLAARRCYKLLNQPRFRK
jgi:hypothetical protein